ncbi:hypothetical protein E9993_17360 [Labilibacter sediminis]|nr:hypothetical protein E9993_17360 [Labilibacter sediminis]
MIKNILLTLIAFVTISTYAQEQSLTIEASQLVSTFSFIDSNNDKQNKDYQSVLTGSYGVGYRHILNNNIILKGGLGKRTGGANYVYDEMNYSWRLEYADIKLGAGYMHDMGRFSPYIVANGYYAMLIRGTQILNNEEFNITESGILENNDIGIIGNIGVNFKMSDYISAYVEGQYLQGLNNVEKESSQTAKNKSYGVTLGLSFNITK